MGWEQATACVYQGDKPIGSAMLVCHGLALTALHVAAEVDMGSLSCEVRPRLRLQFHKGPSCRVQLEAQDVLEDWALLRLLDPVQAITPVPLSRPPGSGRLNWQSLAYPNQARRIRDHERMRLSGTFDPCPFDPREYDGAPVYQLSVQELSTHTLAQGASGAPVIHDGLCLGVLRESQPEGGTLYACPSYLISARVPQVCLLLDPPAWLTDSARPILEPALKQWRPPAWGGPPICLEDPWDRLCTWLRYPGGFAQLLADLYEQGQSAALEAIDRVRLSHVRTLELAHICSKVRTLRSDSAALIEAFLIVQGNRPWDMSPYCRLLAIVEQLSDHPAPALQQFLEAYFSLSNQQVPGLFSQPVTLVAQEPKPTTSDLRVLFKPSLQKDGTYLLWIWHQGKRLTDPQERLTFDQAFQKFLGHLDDLPENAVIHLHAPAEFFFTLPGQPVPNDYGSNPLANLRPVVLRPYDRLHKNAVSLQPQWRQRWQAIAGSRPERPHSTKVCWWLENPGLTDYRAIISSGIPLAVWRHDGQLCNDDLLDEASPAEQLLERVHRLALKFNLAVMWDDPQDSPDYLVEAITTHAQT